MTSDDAIEETVDEALAEDRSARVQRDAARVRELALTGFEGPAYSVFEDELSRESWPIVVGMLRNGALARISQQKFADRGIPFFVPAADLDLLHSNADARDEIAVDVLINALKRFRGKALVEGMWSPDHEGPNGPSCLTTFLIGQCMWEFRRVYLTWAKKRKQMAQQEAAMMDPEAFFRLLRAPQHLSEPEAIMFGNAFLELLDGQPPETQVVVHMTVQGYQDTEIADVLKASPGAVRTRRYRLRSTLYQAARDGRIWIPQQLHTAGAPRHTEAAAR